MGNKSNKSITLLCSRQIEEVKRKVCSRLNVTYEAMHSLSRKPEIVISRYYVYKYVKSFAKLSLSSTGQYTFKLAHDTVYNGLTKLKNYEDTEETVRENIKHFDRVITPIFEPNYIFIKDSNYTLKSYQNRARLFHSVKN